MAAARPVLASLPAESDARQIIADAGGGISVDAGDDRALAAAIQRLASDRRLSQEMGRRGRSYVEEHFSRDVCTRMMEDVMKNAIGE
jgi:glycosyltransferase involved in cell wall biosynthesis